MTDAAAIANARLVTAGLVGRTRLRDVPAHLRASLYLAIDAGLARYDGCVTFGATGVVSYVFIYA